MVAIAADAAGATIKVPRRISCSSNSNSSPRSSSASSIISNINRSNSSISRGTNKSSPRSSSSNSIISNCRHGNSNSSPHRNRTISSSISCGISDSSPYSTQGDEVHHVFVLGVVSSGNFCQSTVQCPLHQTPVLWTRTTRARTLSRIRLLETTPVLGADLLCHYSHPPRFRTCMECLFCTTGSGAAPPPTDPPWRSLCHQESCMYGM